MKFLITGITGFAGPNLANLLIDEGHEVFGLVRHSNGRETDILDIVPVDKFGKIKFVRSDLTNLRTLQLVFKENKFDGIFHLAAQSHPPTSFKDPLGTFNENIIGSANLIQCIEDYNPEAKLMFCSTSEVYGNVGIDGRKIKTTDTLMPANPYGASKVATDLYLQERFENKKITGFITRAFSHTGPRRGKTFSISSDAFQIANMMLGKQNNILRVGNLKTVRVVLDVRDIVNAYYKLMMTEKSNGKVFNISGDQPRKMEYYTDGLIKHSGLQNVEKVIDPNLYRPIDIQYQWGDVSELLEITDWKPYYNIDQTLKDLLDYWVKKLR
jgi:GDP-4-dehydro-6-deoxy-D-mannose reductase